MEKQDFLNILNMQSDMWNLSKNMRNIHTKILLDEEEFSNNDLRKYAELFDIDTEVNIHRSIQIEMIKNMESIIVHDYVNRVLFYGNRNETDNVLYFSEEPFPLVKDILEKGPLYYYLTIGGITYKSLHDKYTKYQLMVLAGVIGMMVNEIPNIEGSKLNIAGEIIRLLQKQVIDHRILLTFNGPLPIHQIEDYNMIDINFPTPDDIKEIAKVYNFNMKEPEINIINKVILSQFWPSFFYDIEWFRDYDYALINKKNTLGQKYNEVDDAIFYGKGTGSSSYRFYTISELIHVWKKHQYFINPRSDGFFSLETMYNLYKMAGKYKNSNELREIMDEIFKKYNTYHIPITNTSYNKQNKKKENLRKYGRVKKQLKPIQQKVERLIKKSEDEYDTSEITEFKDERIIKDTEKFIFYNVERHSLSQLFHLGVMLSDLPQHFEARYDQDLRDKIKTQIIQLFSNDDFSNIYLMTTIQPNFVILPHMTFFNTIRSHLFVFIDLIDYGLINTLQVYGNFLIYTANEYHRKLYSKNIITLTSDPVPDYIYKIKYDNKTIKI
jgi:hypothetical protein